MATTDELKKKDGSAVGLGASLNQPAGALPVAPTQVPFTRDQLIAQIPTGGSGAGPTPQPDPTQSASGTELGRNVNNALNALAPLAGGTSLIRGASRLGAALGASETAAKVASGVAKAMPYAVPAAGALALNAASAPTPSPQAAPAGALPTSQPSAPTPASTPAPGGDIPTAPPMLNGVAGKDVGYGATRFDVPGKSPLFTNMTDAAGLADNAKLMARGAVRPENQAAMDGIQGRQDARDQSARSKMQYDAEVAAAKATNEWQANQTLQNRALAGNRVALNLLNNKNADQTARRGQDIQAGATRDNYKLAQEKLKLDTAKDGRDATSAGFQNRSAQRLEVLQAAYEAAKPEDRAAIAEQLRVMTGKDKPALYKVAAGGQQLDANGVAYKVPDQIYNEQTGQPLQQSQARQSAVPQQAAAMLKANPKMAAEFDAKYGPGQSALILGQK